VTTLDGDEISLKADSICVHGDNQEAVELVKYIRKALKEADVLVKSLK